MRICEGKDGSERTKECEESYEKGEGYEGQIEIECSKENAIGEVSGKKEVSNVAVKFFDYHHARVTQGCSNTVTEGEVDVNTLHGTLGYINKANKNGR